MATIKQTIRQAIRQEISSYVGVQPKYTDLNGVAHLLGMKRTTARGILKQWMAEGRVKPRTPQKKRLYAISEVLNAMDATAA